MGRSRLDEDITVSMLRCFVSLSENLNLSTTSDALGLTRQTVRRQISQFEALVGCKLFELNKQRYILSPNGALYLKTAQSILEQLDSLAGRTGHHVIVAKGLEKRQFIDSDGREYFSQQHPASQISTKGVTLLREAFWAWGTSLSQIEHDAWTDIRPYTVLYRKSQHGWVFVDVGSESAYAKWFGWSWARSARGKLINDDNVGDDFNSFISAAYSRIYEEGGVRLDHIYAHAPMGDTGPPEPGTFQRLLLSGVFPDGTAGLIVVAAFTRNVEIDALTNQHENHVPDEFLMDDVSTSRQK